MRPELALLLATSWVAAAEPPRPQAEASVQLISLAGDRADLALWDGIRATPLRLSADFFGPRLRYAGDTRLRLIQLPTDGARPDSAAPTAPGAPAANAAPVAPGPVIAWLDLPPPETNGGPLRLILLVQPEPGRNGIFAMRDSDRDFPAGSLRFLNLCDFAVSLESGGSATAVAAKGTVVVRPKVAPGGYFDADIYSSEDQVRRLACHLHFFHAEDRRTLLFILPVEKGTGLVRLQPVEEPPPPGVNGSAFDARVKSPKAPK
jgi:hypothetical protein